ncbi:MAG: TIGR03000 domain-containing protein [Gemmataceae bacterium]
MYSAVLMTMLTVGGAEAPSWHHCHGCWGCHHSYCHGGWGCHGCWGCSGCYSCYSSCWGCSGCWGCCGGCYTSCWGCYSSCWGCYGCSSCSGWISGCWGCYASGGGFPAIDGYMPLAGAATTTTPSAGTGFTIRLDTGLAPRTKEEEEAMRRLLKDLRDKAAPKTKSEETSTSDRARVTVKLPADAKLWVDSSYCPLTSDVRSFTTPKLEAGRQYYYTIRMEVDRDGQTLARSQRVYVSAGQSVSVDLSDMSVATVRR